jgi:serine/threonine-protein kinase
MEAFLQERLRLVVALLGIAGFALWVAGRAADVLSKGPEGLALLDRAVATHLGACAAAGLLYGVLRRRRIRGPALLVLDVLVAALLVATCLLIYAFSYRTGIRQLPSLLGLLLIARAVVVPDGPVRTFLLSLPAVPGVLAVQLAHGTVYAAEGVELPGGIFVKWVVWDLATGGLSVALATLTAWVSHSLRRRAWEAGQVERYSLEERIGAGAMGEVWRARHGLLRRPTALKILRPGVTGEADLIRFENEVRQTARLSHPNTVAVFDYGTTADGVFYYAMELVDGADLDRFLRVSGPMPAARVIHVLVQVCGSLEEAHAAGLLHRDVKPANIMLCRRGGELDVVKVMDFGLVRDMNREETDSPEEGITGTPMTMAPEVILRKAPGPAADLYALGAVGCFLLSGKPIFDRDTSGAFLVAHLREPPVPPSERVPGVPRDLEAVLLRCLEKDPAARYAGAAALRAALLACADAGRWTPEDARRWWEENGDRLREAAG